MPGFNPDKEKSGDVTSYVEKLESSISRARQKVFEYAYCNDWDWFVTMTLDPQKYDRYNLDKFHKDLTQWLRDYGRYKVHQKIAFLLVPERHKDGAWHIHGLLSGVPESVLAPFEKGTPLYGTDYLNWPDYAKKFGFCSVGRVKNHEAVSGYITKYITKDMARLNNEVGAHLYYCSRGLKTAERFADGWVYAGAGINMTPDYQGEYCMVKWFDSMSLALNVLESGDTEPIYRRYLDLSQFEEIEV